MLEGMFKTLLTTGQTAANQIAGASQKMQAGADILAKAEYERGEAAEKTGEELVAQEVKYGTARADAARDMEQNKLEIEQQAAEERAAILQEHQDAEAEIREKYQDATRKDAERFQREQERAAEDHQDTLLDAASRLNAPAILAEQRRYTKEEKRRKEDFETSQKERDREYRKELQAEQQAFQKRQQQAAANERRELSRLQQQYNQRSATDAANRAEIARIAGGRSAPAGIGRRNSSCSSYSVFTARISIRQENYTIRSPNSTPGNNRRRRPWQRRG
jgi:hypothetical protein